MLKKPSKNIALFGGSFDPPHLGHMAVVLYLLKNYDEVWILPNYQHAFKNQQSPFKDRLKMCKISFKDFSKVKILDLEKNLSGYTIDTVRALKEAYPQAKFTWILGSDLLKEVDQWKEAKTLKKLIKFEKLARAPQMLSDFPPLSSTQVREKAKKKESLENLVVPTIEAYIRQKKLYQNPKTKNQP
ncbi:MAG: nicotinate (nicotinamide) nucleotide adenylyltransferase [Deltaproteobacteria bacterium]|nr:nicotinate (nicotinamide) nucleotide adenylyltransferase [Deltaproteobacteria bacterium]